MKTRVRRFCQLVATQTRHQTGRHRYPPELRQEAVAIARALPQPVSLTARELGIPEFTLHTWLRSAPAALRPVAITAPTAPLAAADLVLITPSGIRLEGLDVSAAAALLKALS